MMAYITDPTKLIEDLRSQEFDDAADMIERLMAENAKLREALKPFAEEAKAWIDVGDDSQTLFDSDLTIRDVRRAAKLLDAVDSGSVAL